MVIPKPSDHQTLPDPIKMEEDEDEEQHPPLNFSLAGKLLVSHKPNFDTFKHRISRIWDCPSNLGVHDLGRGIYSFRFHHLQDKLRVLEGGPWHYQEGLILLTEYDHNTPPHQLHFTKAKLWVRIHNLPATAFTRQGAKAIGAVLGRLCHIDLPDEDSTEIAWHRKFLRIKVEFDLSKPLQPKLTMNVTSPDPDKAQAYQLECSYERLPDFCYLCGLMGHVYNNCAFLQRFLNLGSTTPRYEEKIRAEKYYSELVLPRDAMVISFNNNLTGGV